MNLVLRLHGLYPELVPTSLAGHGLGASCTAMGTLVSLGTLAALETWVGLGSWGPVALLPQHQESSMEHTIRALRTQGSTLEQLQWGAALCWYKLWELILCSTSFHLPHVLYIRMSWACTVMEISVFLGTFLSLWRNQMVLYCNIWAQKYEYQFLCTGRV